MAVNRRRFLVGSAGLAAAGTMGLAAMGGLEAWLRHEIASIFGDAVAETEAADAFIADYAAHRFGAGGSFAHHDDGYFRFKPVFLPDIAAREREIRRDLMIEFLHATNYVAREETGEEFFYVGLYDPYLTPCMSQLTARAL